MSNVTIKKIHTELLDIPIKRPHQFSTEKVSSKSFVFIRIELSNGIVGIGEGTTPGIWWNGESVETMKLVIDKYVIPLLLNEDPSYIEKLLKTVDRQIRVNPFAKATVEMALFDALGKLYNVPVHQLLGSLYQDKIPVRWALASGTVDGDVQEAKKYVSSNEYVNFKTKSGKEIPEEDAKRNLQIAEGMKGVSTIGIDPNGSWDRITTIKWMDQFFEAGIDFLEQPLSPRDIEGAAMLVDMKKVPVMADESLATVQDAFLLAKEKAANIFSLKIHKSGGMKNTIKIAGIAEAAGISCFGGTSLESSIGTAACLHALASVPNLDYGSELFGPTWLADDPVKEPLYFKDGFIHVPNKPGLGVELDEEKVAKYRRKEQGEVIV
ncbi:muconate/chloromuconate family cycloisomerase [Pseudogracilibacillus auburnensis]|uniref:Muconate cycloisomerase n=1 Tax=Pseudogracilibacillus auburnensis TaxID=1494959 RepID=A0A2V3W3A1_9BACI|nr:muconate/chloromuconate family cycloisomerase [Pseudogracilibacillus auburnensis]PXW87561.1 muconate cycloisomerase [Pseudogracilibacillus auburnensis]